MILEVAENKNPKDDKGVTPLHQAAYKGQAQSALQKNWTFWKLMKQSGGTLSGDKLP